MTIELWCAFALAASLILFIPGPTIIYVIGQSLAHGKKAVAPLTSGVVLGDFTCLLLTSLGLGAILATSSAVFTVIKLLGAAYLIFLGITMILSGVSTLKFQDPQGPFYGKVLFRNVFAITALNPKGVIFFSAFLPQFINPNDAVMIQFILLGSTFLILALFNTLFYALLAGQFTELFRSQVVTRWFNGTGGVALVGAGVVAATLENKEW